MSFSIYKNVIKMITLPEYRGLQLDSSELSEKDFYSSIHSAKSVLIKCRTKEETSGKDSTIAFYITSVGSGITRTVLEFKKLMNKVHKGIRYVYIISDRDFSQQVYNTISLLYSQYTVMKLNNEMFEAERPKHMLIPKHELLTEKEYIDLIKYSTVVSPLNLPKVRMDETQCVWIGANPKDIVKITRYSHSGESINYRIVVGPVSHKVKSDYDPKFMEAQDGRKNGKIVISKDNLEKKKPKRNSKKVSSEIKQKIRAKSYE